MRRWVDRWKIVGPILERERWVRLAASSEGELNQRAVDALTLWEPGLPGDDGEALIAAQRVFSLSRDRGKL
jgi:hypothetical protein